MLVFPTRDNSLILAEGFAQKAGFPWALVKKDFVKYLDQTRTLGLFLVFTEDQETADKIQEEITVENKPLVLGDWLTVLPRGIAMSEFDTIGREKFSAFWKLLRDKVVSQVDYFYAHNVFLCRGSAEKLAVLQSTQKDLKFRIVPEKIAAQEPKNA